MPIEVTRHVCEENPCQCIQHFKLMRVTKKVLFYVLEIVETLDLKQGSPEDRALPYQTSVVGVLEKDFQLSKFRFVLNK